MREIENCMIEQGGVKLGEIMVDKLNGCTYFTKDQSYSVIRFEEEFLIYDDEEFAWRYDTAKELLGRLRDFNIKYEYFSNEKLNEIRKEMRNVESERGFGCRANTTGHIGMELELEKVDAYAPTSFQISDEIVSPKIDEKREVKVATTIATNENTGDDLKMNNNKITNMLGLRNETIENDNVQLDMNGNLCVRGRYVRPNGASAEMGAENKGFLKLLATTVSIDVLKVGDLILDDVNGYPVFVKNVDDIENGELSIQCFIEKDQMVRTPLKNPITGSATVVKLQNIFAIIGIDNLTKLAPLMIGGEDRVMNLVVQQIVKSGRVDVEMLEMELNPSLANINLTKTLGNFVTSMSDNKNIENERKELEEMRKRLELKEKELNEREDELTKA